jgi:hypothetical protein
MYRNLKEMGLGNFKDKWYWSSSQGDSSGAWNQSFGNGNRFNVNRNARDCVRAVRAF